MSHNKSIEKTTSATLKLSQPSTSRHELAERTTLTKKKNISANDRDHSQATKSDTNRRCSWELSIDLLVKVGPNHVHDLLWDDYVSRLSWSLVLQLDRLPQHGGEPSFLEHVIALIQRTMTHDSRLANIVGCLFNNSSLPPIAEAFKSTLFVSLSNTLRRSFHSDLAFFVSNVKAFAKNWLCAVSAGSELDEMAPLELDNAAHRPMLMTTAFSAIPIQHAKLHKVDGPQFISTCTVKLVADVFSLVDQKRRSSSKKPRNNKSISSKK